MKWWDVCVEWGKLYRSNANARRESQLLQFLIAEQMVNSRDRGNVGTAGIAVGMTECGVFATIGLPDSANHTTTAGGTRSQLVYESRRLYVYTEPNPETTTKVVRSFQH